MPQFLTAFEEAYDARVANNAKATGMFVSVALWRELCDANRIVELQAQIRFTSTNLPDGMTLPPIPVDETLPTYRGTIVHVGAHLEDHQFEFSPS